MLCVLLIFCAVISSGEVVSNQADEVTLYPTTGNYFLAHDYLEGAHFDDVSIGDSVYFFKTRTVEKFEVVEIIDAPAREFYSPYTDLYIDGQWINVEQAYERLGLNNPDKLVMQTCTTQGRLFIIADRK